MKKITKLLALLLALLMVATAFTACKEEETKDEPSKTGNSKVEKPEKNNDGSEVEEVVTAYLDAAVEFDFEEAAKYVSADSDSKEALENINIMEGFEGAEEFGLTEKDLKKILDKLSEKMTYEILEVEVDGDEAEVTVEVPNADEMGDITDYVDMDEEALTMKLIEKMGYSSMEEFELAATNGEVTEQDMVSYVGEVIMDVATEAIDNMELGTQEETITLEKIDGDWLIVDDSFAEGLAE
ncbi:MAG: hypothetical protein E7394_01790 [Ruminococcaceae bacterium]|nr:hypothetical protein [Oscillospiraceae bacterium]